MPIPPHDAGNVRWFIFIPARGRFAVPPGVLDREGYARQAGGTRLFHGNRLVWIREPLATSPRRLVVVK